MSLPKCYVDADPHSKEPGPYWGHANEDKNWRNGFFISVTQLQQVREAINQAVEDFIFAYDEPVPKYFEEALRIIGDE